MPLFGSEFLQKLEYLSLVSNRVFRGQILAQRRVPLVVLDQCSGLAEMHWSSTTCGTRPSREDEPR
jgi:hypothetical protein